MSKNLRITGDWPSPEILSEYPNWYLALDEEGDEEQDETTIMPEPQQRVISEDTLHTAGDVVLSSGRIYPAIMTILYGEIESFDYFNGIDWVICRWNIQASRWMPYTQDWLAEEDRTPTVDFSDDSVFPLKLTSRLAIEATGKPHQIQIYQDGTCIELNTHG